MEKTRIDLTYLETFSGGDKTFIAEMMERFLIDAPIQLKEIKEGIDRAEWKAAYKSLHSFKSSVNFIAIQKIKDKVLSMEKMAKEENQVEKLPLEFEELSTEIDFLISELKINLV
ncbi:Hpt domain-containing protein [Flammeovirga yaeyamensis]|uniref:Hpt domain-containing protein n=1 Tax=Flammeovirga yaeyamensis TaxID=367791 RepID=A0AAX1N1K5_9BACT|nr:Hpt domain-containing protein [Flammeovirga yaeyamensis]MBB3698288.1 HPt (histidine-containing phosphotransfer) domain-containing protein [Flammeovirga yaeyamensis]NMF34358.1 hypothetical protein [Flammeovirga yaeyamensis]QWG01339.1 Hpt domain-containing protein [Flammeovirga yaeyamensis]